MRMRNKPWALDYLKSLPQWVIMNQTESKGYWRQLLKKPKIAIEIGTGKGDYILSKASNESECGFIAIEKDKNVAAIAAKKFAATNVDNLRLILGDANDLLLWFDKGEVDEIYLNFSDPWPKRRYHKRRLTHESFLDQYEQILTKNGKIIMKTDNKDLFEFSLVSFSQNDWMFETVSVDFRAQENDDPYTEYERKFVALGHPIYQVIVKKR